MSNRPTDRAAARRSTFFGRAREAAGTAFRRVAAALFTVLVLPALYIVEPFWRIRLGSFDETRIGHLAPALDVLARRIRLGEVSTHRTTHLFFASRAANAALLEMWSRHFPIITNHWLRRASFGFLPVVAHTRFAIPRLYIGNEHREFSSTEPTLSFTAEEERRGQALLREIGVPEDGWFMCFHTRDPAYLDRREGFGRPTYFGEYTYEANIRNASIDNYIEAARWVAEQGGTAIRMGAIVAEPLSETFLGVIDYATDARSALGDDAAFMDLYLVAKSRFFIGCGSGLNALGFAFNVPFGGVNFCPYIEIPVGRRSMYIPKFLHRLDGGTRVSLREVEEMGLLRNLKISHRPSYYRDLGLEWVDNTPDDIRDVARDMVDRLEGREPSADIQRLQRAFRSSLVHIHQHEDAPLLAPRFVAKYADMIEDLVSRPA